MCFLCVFFFLSCLPPAWQERDIGAAFPMTMAIYLFDSVDSLKKNTSKRILVYLVYIDLGVGLGSVSAVCTVIILSAYFIRTVTELNIVRRI